MLSPFPGHSQGPRSTVCDWQLRNPWSEGPEVLHRDILTLKRYLLFVQNGNFPWHPILFLAALLQGTVCHSLGDM